MTVGTLDRPPYHPEHATAVHPHCSRLSAAALACGSPAQTVVALGDAGLRRLGRPDLPDLEWHLLGLDKGDRRARFGSALSDDAIVAYAQRIDLTRGILIGAGPLAGAGLVGLAEAQPTGTPSRVEIAVSVHAPFREQGLGTRLVKAVLNVAFAADATAAEFVFSPENRPIAGLVRGLGAWIYGTLDGAEIHAGVYPSRRSGSASP